MAGVIDSFAFILKKSFDLKLWLYFLLILIIAVVSFGILFFVFLFIGFLLFLILQFSLAGFLFYFIFFILFLVSMFALGSAVNGVLLNFARDYIHSGKIDLGLAFNKTKPRIFTAVKVEVIVGIFFFAVFLLFFLPFIFSLIELINTASLRFLIAPNSSQMLSLFFSVLGSLLLGFLLYGIFSIIVAPFSILYRQIPFFESLSAVDSIKRAVFLARKNYFSNLGFAVLAFIITGVFTFVYMIFSFVLALTNASQIIFLIILAIFLRIILEFAFVLWTTVFNYLVYVKVYEFNSTEQKFFQPKTFLKTKPKTKSKSLKPKPSTKTRVKPGTKK